MHFDKSEQWIGVIQYALAALLTIIYFSMREILSRCDSSKFLFFFAKFDCSVFELFLPKGSET